MEFPIIDTKDLTKDHKLAKQAIDYAASQWESEQKDRKEANKLYNSYNGLIDQSEVKSLIYRHGKLSKTKYTKFRIGRNKVKQVHGEFLQIGFAPTVHTTNREAQNRKMDMYKEKIGLALAKPHVEQINQEGFQVFAGVNMPDIKDKNNWIADNFKLQNEIIMQHITNDKIFNQNLVSVFFRNWVDLTIVSKVFGKVELDVNGVDTYRYIFPPFAMFVEDLDDPFLKRTPYKGEVRPMYQHEILNSREFNLDDTNVQKVKDLFKSDSNEAEYFTNTKTGKALNTYTIEIKGLEPYYVKEMPDKKSNIPFKKNLSIEYYEKNKNQIKRDVKKGKYKLHTRYREILYSVTRIGKDIYLPATKEENLIQVLNENNIFNVNYNYTGMLFGTVNGTRISLQQIIHEYERAYDDIRFQISKELRKPSGSLTIIDEAFKDPNKKIRDIVYDIDEDGVATINSAADGNAGAKEGAAGDGISTKDIKLSQNLQVMLSLAMDLERIMDKVTGMNDSRQGTEMASTTATANQNNLQASRSMTYDMFFFMSMYMKEVLIKLIEKTKLNISSLYEDNRMFVLAEEQIMFLKITRDIMLDNYGVTLTDGRKEQETLSKLEGLFPQEINAGNIRSKDIARFYMSNSFAEAIKVLDLAAKEMDTLKANEAQRANESQQQQLAGQQQMMDADREDRQEHEKELKLIDNEGKKEQILLKGSLDGMKQEQSQNAEVL